MTAMTPERRTLITERLIEDLITTAHEGGAHEDEWLRDLFADGFKGFRNYTDDDLVRAYNDAGLREEYEEEEKDGDMGNTDIEVMTTMLVRAKIKFTVDGSVEWNQRIILEGDRCFVFAVDGSLAGIRSEDDSKSFDGG